MPYLQLFYENIITSARLSLAAGLIPGGLDYACACRMIRNSLREDQLQSVLNRLYHALICQSNVPKLCFETLLDRSKFVWSAWLILQLNQNTTLDTIKWEDKWEFGRSRNYQQAASSTRY